MFAAIRCMLVSRGRAPSYGTFSSELCCGLSLSRRVQNNRMNENRCPEGSKDGLKGRTQCTKHHEKYLQNVAKIIENRGLEGSKIKENRDLEGSSGSSWHVWRDSVRIFDEVGLQMCEVGAKMAPSWAPDAP